MMWSSNENKKKKGKIKRSGMRWRKDINIHEMTVEGRHKRSKIY